MAAPSSATKSLVEAAGGAGWSMLPPQIRADVEGLTGSVVVDVSAPRGSCFPGVAACLRFAVGTRLFLKGIATDHVLFPRYRDEAKINRMLRPARVPVPRLRHAWKAHGWWLMAFDDVTGVRHPDLASGSPDIARVLALLDRFPSANAPTTALEASDFASAVGEEIGGWRRLAWTGVDLDPWAARNLGRLAASERFWLPYADGTKLLHGDLGPDTVLLADRAASDVVIDWAYVQQGADWIDPAPFLPHLIQAGHTPAQAEALMDTHVAAWAAAPPEAITFFVIALTGYWERSSRLQVRPGAPHLRVYQQQMAAIGRSWIAHRTKWT